MKSIKKLSIVTGLLSLLSISGCSRQQVEIDYSEDETQRARAFALMDQVAQRFPFSDGSKTFNVNGTIYTVSAKHFDGPIPHGEWSGTRYDIADGYLRIEAVRYDLYPHKVRISGAYEPQEPETWTKIYHKKTEENLEILLRQIPGIARVDWYPSTKPHGTYDVR